MASDGTRVFVLGGYSEGARADEASLIHVFDTSMHFLLAIWSRQQTENTEHIKYQEHEHNAVNPYEKTTQLAWRPSAVPLTSIQERPQYRTSFSSEDDDSESSTEHHVRFATPHSFSEGEVAKMDHERCMDLERQLLVSLAAQTERDKRISQLTEELALKNSLLEEAEAKAAETAKRARLEPRERGEDRRPMQTGKVKQSDAVDTQAKLEELPLSRSRDQQIGQYEKKLGDVRAKFEVELEAICLRLTDEEKKGRTKSNADADTLRAKTAAGLVSTADEDRVMRRLMERMRAMMEAEIASLRRNEKSRESVSV